MKPTEPTEAMIAAADDAIGTVDDTDLVDEMRLRLSAALDAASEEGYVLLTPLDADLAAKAIANSNRRSAWWLDRKARLGALRAKLSQGDSDAV